MQRAVHRLYLEAHTPIPDLATVINLFDITRLYPWVIGAWMVGRELLFWYQWRWELARKFCTVFGCADISVVKPSNIQSAVRNMECCTQQILFACPQYSVVGRRIAYLSIVPLPLVCPMWAAQHFDRYYFEMAQTGIYSGTLKSGVGWWAPSHTSDTLCLRSHGAIIEIKGKKKKPTGSPARFLRYVYFPLPMTIISNSSKV